MKLLEYFLRPKKTKIIHLFNNFFSCMSVLMCVHESKITYAFGAADITSISLCSLSMGKKVHVISVEILRHVYSMHLPLLVNKVQHIWVLHQNSGSCVTHASWYSHDRMSKTDTEEKKSLIKLFVHK